MKKFVTMIAVIASLVFTFGFSEGASAKTWTSFSNIELNKQWSVKFNRHIDPKSVTNQAYILKGDTKLPTNVSVQDNVLYVKAAQSLSYNTSYTLVVTGQVRDTNGRTMKEEVRVPFTTVAAPSYKTFDSEYNMTWNMANNDYTKFTLTGVTNGQQTGGYETRKGYTVFDITVGANRSTVQQKYGQPLAAIKKGNTNYTQNYQDSYGNVTSGTYLIDNYYVTFFYDVHQNNSVRSIQWVSAATEQTKPAFFRTNLTESYRTSQEELMVHLINQARVAEGLNALIYTPSYNFIGRQHSADMAQNNYFSHTDRNGGNARDRMNAGGLKFSWYGENLAYGQYSAIYAHEALMNSLGHRENILRSNFTHVLVGLEFKSNGSPYFTINFYEQ